MVVGRESSRYCAQFTYKIIYSVSPQKTGISVQGLFQGAKWPQIKKLKKKTPIKIQLYLLGRFFRSVCKLQKGVMNMFNILFFTVAKPLMLLPIIPLTSIQCSQYTSCIQMYTCCIDTNPHFLDTLQRKFYLIGGVFRSILIL